MTAVANRSPGPVTHRPRAALAVTSIGVFVVFLDATIVNVAFTSISRDLGATTQGLAWALNAYSLVFAALLVIAGRVSDQYGRRRLFLLALLGFAATSAVCGLAPTTAWLIAARALQGLAAAAIVPTSLALLLVEFPPERRSAAIGTWGAMGAVASALGPTAGALLVEYASWRWIFLVNVPICVAAAAFVRSTTHEARDASARGLPDPLGVVLVIAFPGLAALAIIEAPTWGWLSARTLGCALLVLVGLLAFLARSRRAVRPVIDLSLFRDRTFSMANAVSLLFSTAFFAAALANIIFLQTVWGWSPLRSALAVTPSALMAAAVAPIGGRFVDRLGHRVVLVPGIAIYAAGILWYYLAATDTPHYLSAWLPATLLSGIGIGLTLPSLSSAATAALPPRRLAVGAAINNSFRQFGAVLGVSVFVAFLGQPATAAAASVRFHHTWLLVAAAALLASALSWGIHTTRASAAATPGPVRPAP